MKKFLIKLMFFLLFSTKVCLFRVGKAPPIVHCTLILVEPWGISKCVQLSVTSRPSLSSSFYLRSCKHKGIYFQFP